MAEFKKILELIENVDPNDTDALDEIDARVWLWIKNKGEFKSIEVTDVDPYDQTYDKFIHIKDPVPSGFGYDISKYGWWTNGVGNYTRSRDALKAIRPEGWQHNSEYYGNDYSFTMKKPYKNGLWLHSCWLPTEELAELHAIIQVLDFERNGGGDD